MQQFPEEVDKRTTLENEFRNSRVPLVSLITHIQGPLYTEVLRGLHVFDVVADSGDRKCEILLLPEHPGVVRNRLEQLNKREVFLSRFRTLVLLVSEDHYPIRR